MTIPDALAHEPLRLTALRETQLLDSPGEEAFDRFTRLAARLLDVPVALFSLVDADRQFFKSQTGLPQPWAQKRETPLSHSFCQHVVASDAPLVVEDARSDPRVQDNLAVRDLDVVAYLGVPVRSSEGFVLGSLCAIDVVPRQWSRADLDALTDIASALMSELELRREIEKHRATTEQLSILNRELGHRISNILSVIAGLISLSVRADESVRPFAEVLRSRIGSLAQAYNYVWPQRDGTAAASSTLHGLIAALLKPYPDDQVSISGDDHPVGSRSATAIALILHELATNGVKYGALSVPYGKVEVTTSLNGDMVRLEWRELGGPAIASPPERNGFGSFLATRSAESQLEGTIEREWLREGLRVKIEAPAEAFA